jgi:hypothetical protein
MADGGLQRHPTTHAVADKVGSFESQVLEKRREVIGHQLQAYGAIDVGRMAVSLQLDADDLPGPGKGRKQLSEHADGAETAM